MPEFSAGDASCLDNFLSEDPYIAAAQKGYIESALWSGVNRQPTDDDPNGEVNDATFEQLADEAIRELCEDMEEFCRSNMGLLVKHAIVTATYPKDWSGDATAYLETAASQAGHDFWLTRNHHGAGYWDRGLGELGEQLTNMAHPYGEKSLYLDDDGFIGVD